MNFLILRFKDGNHKYIAVGDILDFWFKERKDKTKDFVINRNGSMQSSVYDKVVSWELI